MSAHSSIALMLFCALAAGRSAPGGDLPVVVVEARHDAEPAKATFVDPDTLAVIGSASLDAMPRPLRFDASGTVLYLFGGNLFWGKPWTLWGIGTRTFDTMLIGEVGKPPIEYLIDSNSTRLYAASIPTRAKTSSIAAFDLATRKPLGEFASIERLKSMRLSPDGTLLFALCQGKKHKRPRGEPGNLHILDASTGAEIARYDAGRGAPSVAFDSKRTLTYVLGAVDEQNKGRLTVLRGSAITATVTLQARATALVTGPDGTGYLLAKGAVLALTDDGLSVNDTWLIGFDPASLVFDIDHQRMFVSTVTGSHIAELAMNDGHVVVEHATGRAGVKAGKGIGFGLLAILTGGRAPASVVASTPFSFAEAGTTSMSLAPSGTYLYALNLFTNDVSVFDTAKHDVVDFIPAGGGASRLTRADGDPNLWIESRTHLMRLNTSTNLIDRANDLDQGLFRGSVAYDLARHRAWIPTRTKVVVIDLHSGEIAGTVELSSPAVGVWIDNTLPR